MLHTLIAAVAIVAAEKPKIEGGANAARAVEGCMNRWLFDGVWRLRVTSVEPYEASGSPGFKVGVEIANGTTKTISLNDSGVASLGKGVNLITEDGDALTIDDLDYNRLGLKDVIQGAHAKHKLLYHFAPGTDGSASKKVTKFVMLVDPKTSHSVRYPSGDPSFRVDLTCDKAKTS